MTEINYVYEPMENYTKEIEELFGEMKTTISQLETELSAKKSELETRRQTVDLTVDGLKEKKQLADGYQLTQEVLHDAKKEIMRIKDENWSDIRIKLLNYRGVYKNYIVNQTNDLQEEINKLLQQAKEKTDEINRIYKNGERNFNQFAAGINEIVGVKSESDKTPVYCAITDFGQQKLSDKVN